MFRRYSMVPFRSSLWFYVYFSGWPGSSSLAPIIVLTFICKNHIGPFLLDLGPDASGLCPFTCSLFVSC